VLTRDRSANWLRSPEQRSFELAHRRLHADCRVGTARSDRPRGHRAPKVAITFVAHVLCPRVPRTGRPPREAARGSGRRAPSRLWSRALGESPCSREVRRTDRHGPPVLSIVPPADRPLCLLRVGSLVPTGGCSRLGPARGRSRAMRRSRRSSRPGAARAPHSCICAARLAAGHAGSASAAGFSTRSVRICARHSGRPMRTPGEARVVDRCAAQLEFLPEHPAPCGRARLS